ncbi:hypothetical protein Q7P35_002567 [Cladosporium inversicolor]
MAFTNEAAFVSPDRDVETIRATLASLAGELHEMSKTFEPQDGQLFSVESDVVQKARAFIAVAQGPMGFGMATTTSVIGAAVIRTLTHLGAFQAITHPVGATAEQVAQATGAQESLVERLLRQAVSVGFLTYDSQSAAYKHTHLSMPWAQSQSLTSDMFNFIYDSCLAPVVLLPDWLKHNNSECASEPTGDNAGTHNPLTYRHGTEGKSVFETLAQEPDTLAVFGRVLKAASSLKPFVGIYPWERLADPDPQRPLFVDIGGGPGHAIAAILAAHPELPASGFVLQELPKAIEAVKQSLPSDVQLQPHDFFTANPVKGAKVYHLRACLHDWSDEICVRMLKCVVPAMAEDSRLLIAECLLPTDPRDDVGGLMGFQDMAMLCIGGKERTAEGFGRIAREAGLVVERIWEGEGVGRFVVVECRVGG